MKYEVRQESCLAKYSQPLAMHSSHQTHQDSGVEGRMMCHLMLITDVGEDKWKWYCEVTGVRTNSFATFSWDHLLAPFSMDSLETDEPEAFFKCISLNTIQNIWGKTIMLYFNMLLR